MSLSSLFYIAGRSNSVQVPFTSQGIFGMPNNNGFPMGGMPTVPSFPPGFPFSGFNNMLASPAPFASQFGAPFGGSGQFGPQMGVTAPRDPPAPRATRYVVLDSQKRVLPLAGNNIQHAPGIELSGCKDYLIHKPNGDLLVLPPGCTVVQVEGDCSQLQDTVKGVPNGPQDMSNVRCSNCKEYGHRMHDCPKPFNGGEIPTVLRVRNFADQSLQVLVLQVPIASRSARRRFATTSRKSPRILATPSDVASAPMVVIPK